MNPLLFKVPAQSARAELKERGSRFIGLVSSIQHREEAESFIAGVRREHPSARHCCYAWRLFPEDHLQMAHDDGEPRHSAGTPILGQILSRELYGTVVAVVRYFGGTKLGLPGLIYAYKTAASMALDLANTKTLEAGDFMEITFPYATTAAVDRLLHSYQLEPSHSTFEGLVKHTVWVPRRLRDDVSASFLQHPDIQFTPLPSLK